MNVYAGQCVREGCPSDSGTVVGWYRDTDRDRAIVECSVCGAEFFV